MIRERRSKVSSEAVNVGLHPEIHRDIAHRAIDAGQTIREATHEILCEALGRQDLLKTVEHAASA